MSVNLLRKLVILGVVLFVSPACQKSNPARPSLVTPPSTDQSGPKSAILTGLSGNFIGLASEICPGAAGLAIDDLTVNYEVSGRSIEGALLVTCPADNCEGGISLGTITACPLPPNPCEAGLPAASEGSGAACLVGDPMGSGSLRVYATRPADAEPAWHVAAFFQDNGDHTNTVSATVDTAEVVVPANSSMDSARFVHSVRKIHR